MFEEKITYSFGSKKFIGSLFSTIAKGERKLPAVLVAHAWMGKDKFAVNKAKALAELGYIGIALDYYGDEQVVDNAEDATKLMLPLFLDRPELQSRLLAGYDAIKDHPLVDKNRIGGIGFCFGGLAMIELFRKGVDLKGVVTFHAVLANKKGEKVAKTVPISKNIHGSILMLHGFNDPLVSEEDIKWIQNDFNQAKIDWQMNVYSHTSHAFTNPDAHDEKGGLVYNPKSSDRAWLAMKNFFEEVL